MNTFIAIKHKLISEKIKFDEVTFTDKAVSARIVDTSTNNNYNPDEAIKTLVIKTKSGFMAIILRGADRIDQAKLKKIVGKWSMIDFETLQVKFGYVPGTICPLALDLPFLIDELAATLKIWSMGAGAIDKGFNVTTQEVLKHLKNYKITSIRSI